MRIFSVCSGLLNSAYLNITGHYVIIILKLKIYKEKNTSTFATIYTYE